MKKVAVFGKPGSGKSTFSQYLAKQVGLPLHQLDIMVFNQDGSQLSQTQFDESHDKILRQPSWILEGLGPLGSFKQRLAHADTLIYIDLPYWISYWLVTKRAIKGLFKTPEGWPKGCSIIQGTRQSYHYLKLSRQFWNDEFEQNLKHIASGKQLYIVRSLNELRSLQRQLVS
ncbi:adenylate kinase [Pseudoalteromonas luteoviolacea]|uniref:Adenylate kinase n=1 Tax=Pseudoalteromonas luteoviolacea TaxID=43657 RepID=A0A0C1MI53_9GAMM|nr:adenylate kinase [Pseudoalteromonas luteoviolacea]KID56659.1 adenylate kinase [Pseudoalteromonas luteoviolacea]